MSFFAPMTPYASEGAGPAAAAREFKTMVKTLHAHGIEAGASSSSSSKAELVCANSLSSKGVWF